MIKGCWEKEWCLWARQSFIRAIGSMRVGNWKYKNSPATHPSTFPISPSRSNFQLHVVSDKPQIKADLPSGPLGRTCISHIPFVGLTNRMKDAEGKERMNLRCWFLVVGTRCICVQVAMSLTWAHSL